MDLRSPTFESAPMRGSVIISVSGFVQKSYQYCTATCGWFSTLPPITCSTISILRASSESILGRRLHSIFAVFSMTGILRCLASMRRNIALRVLTPLLRAASDSFHRQRTRQRVIRNRGQTELSPICLDLSLSPICLRFVFSPFQGCLISHLYPGLTPLGCILAPLRGCGSRVSLHLQKWTSSFVTASETRGLARSGCRVQGRRA